jgi:hypothetical protein
MMNEMPFEFLSPTNSSQLFLETINSKTHVILGFGTVGCELCRILKGPFIECFRSSDELNGFWIELEHKGQIQSLRAVPRQCASHAREIVPLYQYVVAQLRSKGIETRSKLRKGAAIM